MNSVDVEQIAVRDKNDPDCTSNFWLVEELEDLRGGTMLINDLLAFTYNKTLCLQIEKF